MTFLSFIRDGLGAMFQGSKFYWGWLGLLHVFIVIGLAFYSQQLQQGVIITGMSDQVSWGFYIANFTFMLGIASSVILLLIPAYLFGREDVKQVVLIGQAMAVAAVLTAMLLVIVDLGRPDRMLHLLPFIGKFNLPQSMLAWDVVSLNGFLCLNLLIPFYILYRRYQGKPASIKHVLPFIILGNFHDHGGSIVIRHQQWTAVVAYPFIGTTVAGVCICNRAGIINNCSAVPAPLLAISG
jgi:hypothetical protein